MKLTLVLCLLAALVGLPRAHAYNDTVHFFTSAVALENDQLQDREWQWLSFCAHLPDETREYSAVAQYQRLGLGTWAVWGLFDAVGNRRTREMVTVQQLLHGLTGGPADQLATAVSNILPFLWAQVQTAPPDERFERLCALGFGLHLLGDSFAHRELRHPNLMYRTGLGHAKDGTLPDALLRRPAADGFVLWEQYVTALTNLSGASQGRPAVVDRVRDIAHADYDRDRDQHKDVRKLMRVPPTWLQAHLLPANHKTENCQDFLNSLRADGIVGQDGCALDCARIWRFYRTAAEAEFRRTPGIRLYEKVGTADYPFEDPDTPPPSCD